MHCLVQNRGGDFGVREIRVDGERQLHQACPLLVEVRAPAREALNDDVRKVPLQVAEVVRDVLFDQTQRPVQPRQHVTSINVGASVVYDDGNPTHLVVRRRGDPGCTENRPEKIAQHFLLEPLPETSVGDHRCAVDRDRRGAQLRR